MTHLMSFTPGRGHKRIAGVVATLLVASLAASAPAPVGAIAQKAAKRAAIAANFKMKGNGIIRLAYKAFDPLRGGVPSVPKNLRAVVVPGKLNWWLVQLKYPIRRPARDAVRKLAHRSAGYLPEATFVLEMTPEKAARARTIAGVRWVGLLQPAYKLRPAVSGYPGVLGLKGPHHFRAFFHRGEDRDWVIALMRGIPGVAVDEAHANSAVVPFTATSAEIPAVAGLTAVRYVAEAPKYVPLNYNARWASDTGERDTFWVTAPGHLTGAGQTAAVSDTGINYVTDSGGNAQRAFADFYANGLTKVADYVQAVGGNSQDALFSMVSNGTHHRKMAAYYDLGGDGYEPSESSNHGTHTGGSIAADYPDQFGRYGTYNGPTMGADGMAPGAHLAYQDVAQGPDGGLGGLPSDLYDLYEQVYEANPKNGTAETNPWAAGNAGIDLAGSDLHANAIYHYDPLVDARTHNYSIGPPQPLVDPFGDADRADGFVHDHEDFVAVSSAGNDGAGIATLGGSQTISKNTLSSCASAGGRQPMVTLDSAAEFSSHGPTLEGRIKPDVCTPGQIVISPKGGTSSEDQYLQGTSMSSPVLVGLSTLVRQYFWDGYGPTPVKGEMSGFAPGAKSLARRWNPSAALVKAVLINSAERMRGWYTGDEGSERSLDGQWPSAGQGWGRVELDNALAFDKEARRLFVADVWNRSKQALDFSAADYTIDATAGQPIEFTVVWNDAPASPFTGSTPLVNNLDLTVTAPDGTTYLGNNFTTQSGLISNAPPGDQSADVAESRTTPALPDTRNNVEAVRLEAPASGTYRIHIDGGADATNLIGTPDGPQGYSLVVSGLIGKGAKAPQAADEHVKPGISNIQSTSVASDLAKVTWQTDERTTGAVLLTDASGTTVRYDDVYNPTTFIGEETPINENKGEYADKKATGVLHEVRLTGLKAGARYRFVVEATDLAAHPNRSTSAPQEFVSTDAIFQPDANDVAMLTSADSSYSTPILGQQQAWGTSKQLYTGVAGTTTSDPPVVGRLQPVPRVKFMPAFMFRLSGIDPKRITGAAVELTSGHDITNHYTEDPRYTLSLLNSSVEDTWGPGTSFDTVESAPVDAVAGAQTGLRSGAQTPYTFSFSCSDLDTLKKNLAEDSGGERLAFRLESNQGLEDSAESLFSFETGQGRRSRGLEYRPKLILMIDGKDPRPCENVAAPTISDVRVQSAAGAKPTSVVVNWTTDVPATSVVLFRKAGTKQWTQVGDPFRTTNHIVQVDSLDPFGKYQFAVRSITCNGRETTDDNANKGYALFSEPYYPPQVDGVTADVAATGGTAVIRWITNVDSTGVVEYGTSAGALSSSQRELDEGGAPIIGRIHEVKLQNLAACSVIYFRAVSANGAALRGSSKVLTFQVPSTTLKDLTAVETFDNGLGNWKVKTSSPGTPPTEWAVVNGAARTTIAGVVPGYGQSSDTQLISPSIKTKGGVLEVEFTETMVSEGGFDFGTVEYSTDNGRLWHPVRATSGYGGSVDVAGEANTGDGSPTPRDVRVTITGVPAGSVQIGFRFKGDELFVIPPGWSVDDVIVREALPCSATIKRTAPAKFSLATTFYRVPPTGPTPARAVQLSQDVAFVVTDLNPANVAQRAAGTATCVRVLGIKISRVAPRPAPPPLPATGVGDGGSRAAVAILAAIGLWLWRRRLA